jgi:hypothetical protein
MAPQTSAPKNYEVLDSSGESGISFVPERVLGSGIELI